MRQTSASMLAVRVSSHPSKIKTGVLATVQLRLCGGGAAETGALAGRKQSLICLMEFHPPITQGCRDSARHVMSCPSRSRSQPPASISGRQSRAERLNVQNSRNLPGLSHGKALSARLGPSLEIQGLHPPTPLAPPRGCERTAVERSGPLASFDIRPVD